MTYFLLLLRIILTVGLVFKPVRLLVLTAGQV